MGSLYRRGNVWWVKYYCNGRSMRESSRSSRESDAKKLLAIREGDIARGLPVSPRQARITIRDLLEDVKTDYQINHKKTFDDLEARCRLHLLRSSASIALRISPPMRFAATFENGRREERPTGRLIAS